MNWKTAYSEGENFMKCFNFEPKNFIRVLLVFLLLFFNSSVFVNAEEASDFQIDHADSLEVLDDKIVLNGSVAVSSLGSDPFTLITDKLVSIKDSSGEYSDIETFGESRIVTNKYSLSADKIFFRKDKLLKKFTLLEAFGSVKIISKDGQQKINSPKVKIDLIQKILYAFDGVHSEQIMEDQTGKRQTVSIDSVEQDIDLNDGNNSKKLITEAIDSNQSKNEKKQLTARNNVVTSLDEGKVFSDKGELYSINNKTEKAIFTGNATLKSADGIKAIGEKITYYLNTKVLSVDSDSQTKMAMLTKEDGTEIIGNSIIYNSNSKDLIVTAKADRATLTVPFQEKDGSTSQMTIRADFIKNTEINASESILTAEQNSEEIDDLVELIYGVSFRGWGKKLFISQNKSIPNKKADSLTLIENAKIIDREKDQTLEAPIIQIGLGDRTLNSGFNGRSKGEIPLQNNNN